MAFYGRNHEHPYSRSFRAQVAEEDYRMPASRITKRVVTDCMDYNGWNLYDINDDGFGADIEAAGRANDTDPVAQWAWLRRHGVTIKGVRENGWTGEWHHVGKFANRVDYIDVARGVAECLNEYAERNGIGAEAEADDTVATKAKSVAVA